MMSPSRPKLRRSHGDQAGMTLVEMVIAMGMLVIFTSVVATSSKLPSSSFVSPNGSISTRCWPASAPTACC